MPAPQTEPPGGSIRKRGLGLQPRNSIYATPHKSKTRATATGARSCLDIDKSPSSTRELVRQLQDPPKASPPQSSPPRWSPAESSPGQSSRLNESPLSQYLEELKARALQRAQEIRGALASKKEDEVTAQDQPDDERRQSCSGRSRSSSRPLQKQQEGAIAQRTRGGACTIARERSVSRLGAREIAGSEIKPRIANRRRSVVSPKTVASRERPSPKARSVKRKLSSEFQQVPQRGVGTHLRRLGEGNRHAVKEPVVIEQRTGAIQLNGVPGTVAALQTVACPGRVLVRPKRAAIPTRRKTFVSHAVPVSPASASTVDLVNTEDEIQLPSKRRIAISSERSQTSNLQDKGSPLSPHEARASPSSTPKARRTQAVVTRMRTTTSQRLVALLREPKAVRDVEGRAPTRVVTTKDDTRRNDRKRPLVMPYMPPGVRHRRKEQEDWELEKAERRRRLAAEESASSNSGQRPPNIRALARKWEAKLELPGTCCFNPLQKDEIVEVDDDCLLAECCCEHGVPRPALGVKGLPMIARGRYQFEVELLRDSDVIVGWSAATSLPSTYDAQSFGYGPRGFLAGEGVEQEVYGVPFGCEGDVIGAFLEWPLHDSCAGPRISFALNGRWLGVAFDFTDFGRGIDFPALQPHICQASGLPFKVLLRGAHPSVPLRFHRVGFEPLGDHLEAHFCPFSEAVAQAGDSLAECRSGMGKTPTVARRLIHGSLGLQLPLSHLAQEIQAKRRNHRSVFECDDE